MTGGLQDVLDGHARDFSKLLDAGDLVGALHHALEQSCQAQNVDVISQGRIHLWRIALSFVRGKIVSAAREVLDLDDEYEYRRLLEAVEPDPYLVGRVVQIGFLGNEEIRSTAREWECFMSQSELDEASP